MPDREGERRVIISRERAEHDRARIMQSWERARATDPTVTQARFMREATRDLPYFKNASNNTLARYFRKIRDRERTGSAMYEYGTQEKPGRGVGLFQFKVRTIDGRYISQNIDVAGARSTFDNAAIEYELKRKRSDAVAMAILAAQRDTNTPESEIDLETLEVRPIARQRRSIRMRLAI